MNFSCYDILANPVTNKNMITDINSVDKVTIQFEQHSLMSLYNLICLTTNVNTNFSYKNYKIVSINIRVRNYKECHIIFS